MTTCQECGMACDPAEYHPFAACLMFKACHNGGLVRDSLKFIQEEAARQEREAIAASFDNITQVRRFGVEIAAAIRARSAASPSTPGDAALRRMHEIDVQLGEEP